MEKCEFSKDLVLFKIFELHKIICNKANKIFSKEGVNIQVEQIPVLMVVYYTGPQSQQDIAHELVRDKSSVMRTIGSLLSFGYLHVEADTTDKRKKLVKLTARGKQLAERISDEISVIDTKMFSNLTTAEKLILIELLNKCNDHINTLE